MGKVRRGLSRRGLLCAQEGVRSLLRVLCCKEGVMKLRCVSFLLVLIAGVFIWSRPLTAELVGDASFEGVVLTLSGVPSVVRGEGVYPLAPGMFILPGDQVCLLEGDEVSILMRTGRILELYEERRVRLSDEFGQEEWFSQEVRDILHDRFGLYDSELGRGVDPSTNAFRPIYPYNSSVREGTTEFRWAAPTGMERFSVEVFEEDLIRNIASSLGMKEVGIANTWTNEDSTFTLIPGRTYSWRVRGWDGYNWQETDKVFFRMLDRDTASRIRGKLDVLEGMKKKDRHDIMPWVIASILLMKEKLYHQALEQVAAAISINDLAPFPYTLRGRIYEEMNLSHLALGEYQVAARLGGN